MLPGTGRDAMLSLRKEADAEGYGVTLDDGVVVGHFELFDEALLDGMNVVAALLRSPESLACLLEAAGAVALERCGAILDASIAGGLIREGPPADVERSAGGASADRYLMRATLSIRMDEKLHEALRERAALQGKTVSQLAREILSEALEERTMATRIGHLRGRLKLPPDASNAWRTEIRRHNWRP